MATHSPIITYRRLWPTDHEEWRDHLLRLDADSRRLRFGMVASDDFITQYATRCLDLNAVTHGAFAGGALVGAAELRPLGPGHAEDAEVAFSVLSTWRNRGIGTRLFARLIRSARNRGLARLYMSCLRDNAPMQALARHFSAELAFESGDTIATVCAPRRTIISLMSEALDDASSLTASALDQHSRGWQRMAEAVRPQSR